MPSTTGYRRGDIVLVSFPFTDLTSTKRRPALVVSPDPFNELNEDLISAAVTSQVTTSPHAVPVAPTDCQDGSLPRESFVKHQFRPDREEHLSPAGRETRRGPCPPSRVVLLRMAEVIAMDDLPIVCGETGESWMGLEHFAACSPKSVRGLKASLVPQRLHQVEPGGAVNRPMLPDRTVRVSAGPARTRFVG
jgi:hypothetical protein